MPRRRLILCLAVTASALALGCRPSSGQLGSENAEVEVSATALSFGNVYVGAHPQQLLSVENNGGAPDEVTVAAITGSPFTSASGTFTLAGGASEGVTVTFQPTAPGPAQATLHLSWTGGSADVPLTGNALAWPACTPQGLCGAATFDPNAGTCTQSTLPDGAACSDSAGCLSNAQCQGGRCLGTVASCDDGDACTTDVCVIGQGCQHTPIACPSSGNPCQPTSCDPTQGCLTTKLPDGAACAGTESCQSATICVSGSCTGTPVPDGTPCSLDWAPCVGDATCKSGTCDSPTADGYQPGDVLWSSASAAQGGLAVDTDGGVYFVAGGSVVGLDQCGGARWTSSASANTDLILDGDQLVAFDSSVPQLLGLDLVSGAPLWTLSLPSALLSICPAADFGGVAVGGSGGSQRGASLSEPVMSSQGQIFVAGNCTTPGDASAAFLLAVFRDGSVDWLISAPYADAAPVVDPSGNVYLATSSGDDWSLSSFDPLGASRFAAVTYAGEARAQLVAGASQIVDLANGQSFGLDGSPGFDVDVDTGPFANAFYDSIGAKGGAVDGPGNVYFAFTASGGGLAWAGLSPSGSLLWSAPFASNDDVASYPVLSAEGTLFAIESADADDNWQTPPTPSLVALDTASGQQLWSKPSAAASSLALGSGGMLLLAGSPVQSVYVGQVHASSSAPWSRYRGGNANSGAGL